MSDGENVLLAEVDQDIIREQNIASYPKNIIGSVTIFFVFAAVSNIFPLFFVYKEIYFLNQKIKQRRKRRAIKEWQGTSLPYSPTSGAEVNETKTERDNFIPVLKEISWK